jgi:nitroreductase
MLKLKVLWDKTSARNANLLEIPMSFNEDRAPVSPPFPEKVTPLAADILPALSSRWSPVRFDPFREVEPQDLEAVLEAARWAPSSYGEEPWRFLVARRHDPHRPILEEALAEGNRWAVAASVLIVTLAKRTFSRNGKPNRFAEHDVGLATAALLAEATHRGLITHPMGGFDTELVRREFGIPDDLQVMAMIALGWHDPSMDQEHLVRKEARPRRRRELRETVLLGV